MNEECGESVAPSMLGELLRPAVVGRRVRGFRRKSLRTALPKSGEFFPENDSR